MWYLPLYNEQYCQGRSFTNVDEIHQHKDIFLKNRGLPVSTKLTQNDKTDKLLAVKMTILCAIFLLNKDILQFLNESGHKHKKYNFMK